MVGNAVPPQLAFVLAKKIYEDLKNYKNDNEFIVKNHRVENKINK